MNVPKHIGVIMDGNGRWARGRGLPRTAGHRAGTDATREIVRACGEFGVSYLTVYVFSAENWGRPRVEVSMLMDLLVEMTRREIKNLNENNVRLMSIGDLEKLPPKTRAELVKGIEDTKDNTGLTLILAISYGGRLEIVNAAKAFAHDALCKIMNDVVNKNNDVSDVADNVVKNIDSDVTNKIAAIINTLDEQMFGGYLYTKNIPDPELIIRTGGDYRISNFLLWQAAYAELYITDTLWPDFDRNALLAAIENYNKRERRFGKVKE